MPVYLPTSIVGNSSVLATIGASGELMAFFYPRIDWAQNVHEALVYIVIESDGRHHQHWTFEDAFERKQEYLPESTVVETELIHRDTGLIVTQRDFVLPQSSSLIRHFTLRNSGAHHLTVRLYQYMDLSLGEVAFRNAVHYLPDESVILQQWHEFCFAVGGDPADEWQCGKSDSSAFSNAKNDLTDGHLNGQSLDIGDVNFGVGWSVGLRPGESASRYLCVVPAKDETSARKQLHRLRKRGVDHLLAETLEVQRTAMQASLQPCDGMASLPPDLQSAYMRATQILPLLFDRHSGACLAAPEFDPCFVQSGGYGYCWPRDAAIAVVAVVHAGVAEYAEPFFEWCRRSQSEEGYWHQRYWLSGDVGPSWCTPDSAIQIDQTGAVVHAMSLCCDALPDSGKREFVEKYWSSIQRATEYLASEIAPNGLHETAYDLWETFRGTFLYSNAAIYAALMGASRMAQCVGETDAAERWRGKADQVKSACLTRFWNGTCLMRGLGESGEPDTVVDSSVLGALVPFGLIDLSNPAEKAMLESTIDVVTQLLEVEVHPLVMPSPAIAGEGQGGGRGIRRYENDSYAGGPAAAVNTLWMALAQLKMAEHELASGDAHVRIEKAVGYMRTCLSRATPTGLLPELMGGPEGAPWWAAPHAWCTGWYIECCLTLRRIGGA